MKFSRLSAVLLLTVSGLCGCSERKDASDRHPGPEENTTSTNIKEGSANGRGVSPATGVAATLDQPVITSVQEIMNDPNPAALETRQVQLSAVPVQRVLNSQYVLVGTDQSHVIPVRLKELQPNLREGQRLNVGGMISQLGEDLAHWELDEAGKKVVSQFKVFINAFQSEVETNANQR